MKTQGQHGPKWGCFRGQNPKSWVGPPIFGSRRAKMTRSPHRARYTWTKSRNPIKSINVTMRTLFAQPLFCPPQKWPRRGVSHCNIYEKIRAPEKIQGQHGPKWGVFEAKMKSTGQNENPRPARAKSGCLPKVFTNAHTEFGWRTPQIGWGARPENGWGGPQTKASTGQNRGGPQKSTPKIRISASGPGNGAEIQIWAQKSPLGPFDRPPRRKTGQDGPKSHALPSGGWGARP